MCLLICSLERGTRIILYISQKRAALLTYTGNLLEREVVNICTNVSRKIVLKSKKVTTEERLK
jgi:hypothetical protein